MRFQTGHAEVLSEGFGQSTAFGIANNAKAFKGLIDGLYSRKIEASVRELATNAFDAHKAAGSIAPFALHLPTPLKPTFWIRDFGPGMSHEFMMSRFAIMFESTKDGTNAEDASLITPDDQVGCLGLGRMSFFAYTDACTLTVWQDGEARHYSVYIGPGGVPVVSHAGTVASDEPAGVKVEFPVKTRDFKSFQTAAIRVFKGFPIQPKGLSIDARDAIAEQPMEVGGFWKAYSKDYLPEGGFYARQGCVLYPIDLTQIDDRLVVTDNDCTGETEIELSETYARFAKLDMTIVIDFPIGSIDFDLGRERLAYNDRTVEAIRDRWTAFIADLDAVITKEFAGKTNGFERMVTARSPLFEGLGPLFQQSGFFVEAGAIEKFIHELLPSQRRSYNSSFHAFKRVVEYRDKDDANGGDNLRDAIFTCNQRLHGSAPALHDVRDAVFVYNDDTPRGLNDRVHYHLRQVGKRFAYIFEEGGLTKARWKKMGSPPILRSSEIVIPKAVRERIARKGNGGGVFDRIKVIDGDAYRAPTADEDTEGHLFAFINKGELINPDPDRHPDLTVADVVALHHILKATDDISISFVNTRTNDKEGRWDHLPTFYDTLDTFAERLSKKQIGQFVAWLNSRRFCSSRYDRALSYVKHSKRRTKPLPANPLTALLRFELSKSQTDPELTPRFHHLVDSTNPVMEKITNDVIAIATKMGMEVLPPLDSVNLLSKEWEQRVQNIIGINGHGYASEMITAREAFYNILMQPTKE